ncbi:50S ribosomal protein L13 [Patescibacteria group bacterium]|nr:50S ribosomal protein L13 [Patescibacteria group bacterium]
MKTFQPKAKDIKRQWHLIDIKGAVLGRTASKISTLLMGKNKVNYAPHMDMGDYVVVVNAKDVRVTGKKESQKVYYRHSGYPGGFKEIAFSKLKKKHPEKIIELAVKRMLPTNRLKDKRMSRLKVFADSNNPYKDKFKNPSTK